MLCYEYEGKVWIIDHSASQSHTDPNNRIPASTLGSIDADGQQAASRACN